MDESKAIKIIKQEMGWESKSSTLRAFEEAIKALEEVQQYRAIGTPEELRTMKEHGGFSETELAEIAVALTGFKEYQQLGTPEECRAAMEKQRAKKVAEIRGGRIHINSSALSM